MLDAVAALYTSGVNVDWRAFDAPYSRRRVVLPTYPFQRERYWSVPAPSTASPEPVTAGPPADRLPDLLYDVAWVPMGLRRAAIHRLTPMPPSPEWSRVAPAYWWPAAM
jgi:acyl transferase domain-containing protein